jgi:hypothetical protein
LRKLFEKKIEKGGDDEMDEGNKERRIKMEVKKG